MFFFLKLDSGKTSYRGDIMNVKLWLENHYWIHMRTQKLKLELYTLMYKIKFLFHKGFNEENKF